MCCGHLGGREAGKTTGEIEKDVFSLIWAFATKSLILELDWNTVIVMELRFRAFVCHP